MTVEQIIQSKIFRAVIIIIAGVAIITFVFSLGIIVGIKKAPFTSENSGKYYRIFQVSPTTVYKNLKPDVGIVNGCYGRIIAIVPSVDEAISSEILVADSDGTEKLIIVDKNTIIRKQNRTITILDLRQNDNIVTLGDPNQDGTITARLIRVMSLPYRINPVKESSYSCHFKNEAV